MKNYKVTGTVETLEGRFRTDYSFHPFVIEAKDETDAREKAVDVVDTARLALATHIKIEEVE